MSVSKEPTYTFILEGTALETEGLIVAMTGQTVSSMNEWLESRPGQYKIIKKADFNEGVEFMTTNRRLITERRLSLKLKMFKEGNEKVLSRL